MTSGFVALQSAISRILGIRNRRTAGWSMKLHKRFPPMNRRTEQAQCKDKWGDLVTFTFSNRRRPSSFQPKAYSFLYGVPVADHNPRDGKWIGEEDKRRLVGGCFSRCGIITHTLIGPDWVPEHGLQLHSFCVDSALDPLLLPACCYVLVYYFEFKLKFKNLFSFINIKGLLLALRLAQGGVP